jgi:hypothetical protein
LLPEGQPLPKDQQREIMRRHGASWRALTPGAQRRYEAMAELERSKKDREQQDSIAHAQAQLQLEQQRLAATRAERSRKYLMSLCRFSLATKDRLDYAWASPTWTAARVAELRAQAEQPPPPPAPLRALLEAQRIPEEPMPHRPPWLATLCLHRELFAEAALVVHGDHATDYWKVLFAQQQPYFAVFVRMFEVESPAVEYRAPSPEAVAFGALEQWPHHFGVDFAPFVEAHELNCEDVTKLSVLPRLVFLTSQTVVTDAWAEPWEHFTRGLTQGGPVEPARPAAPRVASAAVAEAVAANPWLQDWAARRQRPAFHGVGRAAAPAEA